MRDTRPRALRKRAFCVSKPPWALQREDPDRGAAMGRVDVGLAPPLAECVVRPRQVVDVIVAESHDNRDVLSVADAVRDDTRTGQVVESGRPQQLAGGIVK